MHLGYIDLEKVCSLVWSEILRLFVNTFTADNKYSHCNVHHFAQQLQTPLSQKQKTFCWFFIAFLKCAWNLEHFEKKDEYPSLNYFRNYGLLKRWLLKRLQRCCFRRPCGNQRVNGFQALLKSARHHYYPIFSMHLEYIELEKSLH